MTAVINRSTQPRAISQFLLLTLRLSLFAGTRRRRERKLCVQWGCFVCNFITWYNFFWVLCACVSNTREHKEKIYIRETVIYIFFRQIESGISVRGVQFFFCDIQWCKWNDVMKLFGRSCWRSRLRRGRFLTTGRTARVPSSRRGPSKNNAKFLLQRIY